jgi:hypothetical protein
MRFWINFAQMLGVVVGIIALFVGLIFLINLIPPGFWRGIICLSILIVILCAALAAIKTHSER